MTITEILLNFREALLGIIPAFHKVGIPWKRPHAYDEWDEVASALFDSLVAQVLEWPSSDGSYVALAIPGYDMMLEDYSGLSLIEVSHPSLTYGRFVFHSFASSPGAALDVVEMRTFSEENKPLGNELENCPVKGASFVLKPNSLLGLDTETIERIAVDSLNADYLST